MYLNKLIHEYVYMHKYIHKNIHTHTQIQTTAILRRINQNLRMQYFHFSDRNFPEIMRDWSINDVSEWLRSIEEIDEEVVSIFRKQKISGKSLIKLDSNHLDRMSVVIGDQISILEERDTFLSDNKSKPTCEITTTSLGQSTTHVINANTDRQQTTELQNKHVTVALEEDLEQSNLLSDENSKVTDSTAMQNVNKSPSNMHIMSHNSSEIAYSLEITASEVLRPFLTSNKNFKYKYGAQLSCIETRTGGNLLLPVHRFVALDDFFVSRTATALFAKETIQYVCACMNDRSNGTIHFGIQPEQRNSVALYGTIIGILLRKDFKTYQNFIEKAFRNCFFGDQVDVILNSIGPIVFIEVLPNEGKHLYVIEIDVIPKHSICKDKAFFAQLPTEEKNEFEKVSLFRIVDGKPRALQDIEQIRFMGQLRNIAQDRQEQEEKAQIAKMEESHFSKKFVNLICHGQNTFR